jgi:serine-type D-ala-D-ala carboxypeptidase
VIELKEKIQNYVQKGNTEGRNSSMPEGIKRLRAGLLALVVLLFSIAASGSAEAANAPEIASEGAVLYNATSGKFLYEKNANHQYYPASITKFMTALLVLENASQDDTVVFSSAATENLESGAVNLEVAKGDRIKVRDCLYGLMLKSANEVANGLAEHVSGSVPSFAKKMNRRAQELGCTNTNFVNPSGLNNAKHLSTPHDMALIAKACFDRADFRDIDRTVSYHFPATQKRPNGTDIVMGHRMISSGNADYYPGILGGKTGYTSAAGNTLVTCAERNGVRLIVVVMKSRKTQYSDTRALLDYGFQLAEENGGKKPEAVGGETEMPQASGRVQALTANSPTENLQAANQASPAENPQAANQAGSQQSQAGSLQALKPAGSQSRIVSQRNRAVSQQNQAASQQSQAANPAASGSSWIQRNGVWAYREANGALVRNARREINGKQYWFDENGNMLEGWRQDGSGAWYYLTPGQGALQTNSWLLYKNQWYYLGSDGKMLTESRTPDGYLVNKEGIWIG